MPDDKMTDEPIHHYTPEEQAALDRLRMMSDERMRQREAAARQPAPQPPRRQSNAGTTQRDDGTDTTGLVAQLLVLQAVATMNAACDTTATDTSSCGAGGSSFD